MAPIPVARTEKATDGRHHRLKPHYVAPQGLANSVRIEQYLIGRSRCRALVAEAVQMSERRSRAL
jgi:hypothetical protein